MRILVTKGDLCSLSKGIGLFKVLSKSEKQEENQLVEGQKLVNDVTCQTSPFSQNICLDKLGDKILSDDRKVLFQPRFESVLNEKDISLKKKIAVCLIDLFLIMFSFTAIIAILEFVFFDGVIGFVDIFYRLGIIFYDPVYFFIGSTLLYLTYLTYRGIFVKISKMTPGQFFWKK